MFAAFLRKRPSFENFFQEVLHTVPHTAMKLSLFTNVQPSIVNGRESRRNLRSPF